MNGRCWETADRQVVAVNALEIVPVGQCSLVRVHRHRVEVPQVGDVVDGWVDHDRAALTCTPAGSCSDSGCQSSQSAGSRSFQRQGGHSRKRIDERTVSEQHAKRLKKCREYQACKRSAAVVEAEFPSDEELQAMLLSAQGRQRFPKTSALLETNKAQAHMAQQPNSVSPEGAAADSEVPVSSGKKGVEKRASKQAATIKPTASNSSGAAAAASTRQPRSKAAKVDSYAESDAEDDEGSEYEEPATRWMCAYCNYPNPLGPGDQEFAGCINCGGLASSDDESDLEEDE
eukprot:g45004.t1